MGTLEFVRKYLKEDFLKDFFLLIVLIGLLPAVEDYSLFAFFGFTINDFIIYEEVKLLYSIPIILLPPAIIIAMNKKIPFWVLGLLPAIYAAYMTLLHQMLDLKQEDHGMLMGIAHLLCYQLAFIYFIAIGRLRSLPFWTLLLIILVVIDVQHLILFATYAVLVRFLYLALIQNVHIFQETGLKKSLKLALKSFLYWSPLLIVIIPSAIFSSKLNKGAIDQIYENTFVFTTCERTKYQRDQFERDLEISLNSQLDTLNNNIMEGANNFEATVADTVDIIGSRANFAFDQGVPQTLPEVAGVFKISSCFFLDIPCHLKNSLKYEMNRRYQDNRKQIKQEFTRGINEAKTDMEDATANAVALVNNQVEAQTPVLKKAIKSSIQSLFDFFLFFGLLTDIAFGFLILKSFLYVFARVAFSSSQENYVTLMEPDEAMPSGILKKCGNHYTIPASNRRVYYVSRSFEPSGQAPKFSLPQWSAAILARVTSANYAMNKIVMDPGKDPVNFRAMGGNEFVEWELKEGEEVIFRFSNFVGMSESIKLSAVVSLRITSLLMGRLIFTSAKGPGRLILLTTGEPITSGEQKANTSVATSRILAWQKNTRFNVESELSLVDVFMSGIYMKKQKLDLILIDADVKGRAKSGIVRFIKNFILPV